MKRWVCRAFRKDVDSEGRKLCGRSFQVVGAVKEKDLWPKVFVETRGTVRMSAMGVLEFHTLEVSLIFSNYHG